MDFVVGHFRELAKLDDSFASNLERRDLPRVLNVAAGGSLVARERQDRGRLGKLALD